MPTRMGLQTPVVDWLPASAAIGHSPLWADGPVDPGPGNQPITSTTLPVESVIVVFSTRHSTSGSSGST